MALRKTAAPVLAGLLSALALALLPAAAGAQDRDSHWGVSFGFTPRWSASQSTMPVGVLWDNVDELDLSGSTLRAGIIRGSELGGDWGISFVRRRFRDGSVVDFTSAGDARYVTDGVSLTGVEIHRFSPFITVAGAVQIGMEYGGGVGTLAGDAIATNRPGIGVRDVTDALREHGIPIVPLARAELAAAVIAAPGVKVRIKGGFNFPGLQTFSVTINYLFGSR